MNHGGRFDTPEFDERCFRYSVRCDREKSKRIEAAARKAGVSANTFVQQHFDAILDEPADETGFAAGPFARDHGISEAAARMWNAMRHNADSANVISGAVRDLAEMAKVAAGRGSDCLAELMDVRLIKLIARAGNRHPSTYRVMMP